MNLLNTILNKMSNISKPQRKFIATVLTTITIARGRINFRNMSRYSKLSEKTYSRNFRKSFDFQTLNTHLIRQVVDSSSDQFVAVDCSFIDKSGKHTFGLGKFYDSKINKAQKGLEVSHMAVVDVGYNTAYPLCIDQTPVLDNCDQTRMDWYVSQIKRNRTYLPEAIKYVVADGYYAKKKFVDGVLDQNLHTVGKLRKDANLRWLYQGPVKQGRGRPKKYDGKVRFDDFSRFELVTDTPDVSLYTAVVNSVCFKRNIRIVLGIDKTANKRSTFLLFSTDVDQCSNQIYLFYKTRFQIEFLFRDAKQYTGLSDCQARSKETLHFHFNASMSSLGLLKVQDRLSKVNSKNNVISISSWKTRKFNEFMLKSISSMLDIEFELIKKHKNYKNIKNLGAITA